MPADELFDEPGRLEYVDAAGHEARLDVPAGGVAFTFCQVPVIYRFGGSERSVTILRGPAAETIPGDTLPAAVAEELFRRTGSLTAIEVAIPGYPASGYRASGDRA